MDTLMDKKSEDTRIDVRISKEEKDLYENAKDLSGARSLSEFVRHVLHKEAKAIIEERKRILASERDKEIFFSALMDDIPKVNDTLVAAFKRHKNPFINK